MEERFIADEMLGRLARYLRILGYDTEYARDTDDEAIRARADSERRILLTRDRELARRTPGAILLRSPRLAEQLAEVRRRLPRIGFAPRFDRCTVCNGELAPAEGEERGSIYACRRCGQRYWEGSHTRRIREFLGHLPQE